MSSSRPIVIEAGRLFTPAREFAPGRIIIEGRSISEAGSTSSVPVPSNARIVDARRFIVTPGFIDPHIHGCGGADTMDGTFESLNKISRLIARHGTTSFLPTTVSSPPGILSAAIGKLGAIMGEPFDGAQPIGIHMEGPFISEARRGTHKALNVIQPDETLFQEWLRTATGSLRLITIAPELKNIEIVIQAARAAGVVVAMGHSNATYEQASAAAAKGVEYAVHTFNAMREFNHRDPGIVGAVLADNRIFAEVIADGTHVNPAVVRILARAKDFGRVLLVTDAISATGMPDGCYMLGTDSVNVAGGVCRDSEGRLAGSTLTQEVALRNFMEWSGCQLQEALLGLTANPAQALKLQKKGVLEPGADADLTILDENLRVMETFVAGRSVFQYGQA